VVTPRDLFVPRVIEEKGLAGYERDSLACFLALLQHVPGTTVFDVGANVGVFTLLGAALTDWEIVAFEPVPRVAQALRDIAVANDVPCTVEEIAFGSSTGTATMYLSNMSDASASLKEGFRPSSSSIDVPVERIDDYCARTGRTPSIFKIDTEATEPEVLRGMTGVVAAHRPWIICEVLPRRTEADLTAVIEPLGYHWYQITHEPSLVERAEIFGDRTLTYSNWLFAPQRPTDALWKAMRVWRKALDDCAPSGAAPAGGPPPTHGASSRTRAAAAG
jgi:FkbM family methyltransferase